MAVALHDVFGDLPEGLRSDILTAFSEVVKNYRERRWEPSELNGGKLCEAVYTAVLGLLDGQFADRASKPRDMVSACRALEQRSGGSRSFKVQIPRMITALYEVRNNRGVGHAGGDVDPNHMDATAVLYMSKWLVAELVRALHNVPTHEATALVDVLVEREVPLVWSLGERKRVLRPRMSLKEKTLLLLLGEPEPVHEADLMRWLEHRDVAVLRRDVLRPLHNAVKVDYDRAARTVVLLPPGVAAAEALLAQNGA